MNRYIAIVALLGVCATLWACGDDGTFASTGGGSGSGDGDGAGDGDGDVDGDGDGGGDGDGDGDGEGDGEGEGEGDGHAAGARDGDAFFRGAGVGRKMAVCGTEKSSMSGGGEGWDRTRV